MGFHEDYAEQKVSDILAALTKVENGYFV